MLPTSLVGSYPQPDWLIDREKLAGRFPPRVRARSCGGWRPNGSSRPGRRHPARHPRPGARRARHHHRWRDAPRKLFQPLRHRARRGRSRQSGQRRSTAAAIPIRCRASSARSAAATPSRVRDVQFLRANTDRMIKITVPGPFTMTQQAQNDFYKDEGEMAHDYAAAVNDEIKDLFAAGADVVQIDEPYMQARPDKARELRRRCAQSRARRRQGTDRGAHLLRLRRVHPRAARGLFVPARAGRHQVGQISIETAQSNLDCSVLQAARSQNHHPRRARSFDPRGRNARDRRRAHPPRPALCQPATGSSSRPIAA